MPFLMIFDQHPGAGLSRRDPARNSVSGGGVNVENGGMATHLVSFLCICCVFCVSFVFFCVSLLCFLRFLFASVVLVLCFFCFFLCFFCVFFVFLLCFFGQQGK